MSEPTRTHAPEPEHPTRTRAPNGTAEVHAVEIVAPAGYEFVGEIGRGGMGVVFRALDLDLGRSVAVKVLLPQYAPNSPTARRFLDEARITGRLQHPGIPPIYRVGTYDDGRPFLAMKLIGGDTLEHLLKVRTDPEAASAAAPNHFERMAHGMFDRLAAFLESGRFLAIFEHVAQAVAYAHQEGVIHRDLKPANVMVGDFGEVQVMDWGIARSGDRRQETGDEKDSEPATTVAYLPPGDYRTPHSDLTQAGAILGTPAYMPPEQAIGAVDQIGKHSDVFGLGAILCVILTGKPPYVGADAESNRQLAARAKLDDAFARLDASGAEPELISLAKRCLAAEPKDRPANAGEVWEAVAAFRADSERRARLAEMDRARAEVRNAEERKRRKVKYALALSMLGLLAVLGVAAWWVDSVRAARRSDQMAREHDLALQERLEETRRLTRRGATERDVLAALNEAQLLREQGWDQTDEPMRWALTLNAARSAQRRADAILASGEPTDDLRLKVDAAELDLTRDEREQMLLAELDRIADSNEIRLLIPVSFTGVTARQYAEAFRKNGLDLLKAPTNEAVAWLKSHRLRHRLVIAIRNWQLSFPGWDVNSVADTTVMTAVVTSASVAGYPAIAALAEDPHDGFEALLRKTGPYARLAAILKAVTDDSFTREWWDTVGRLGGVSYSGPLSSSIKWNEADRNGAIQKLKEMIKRPEFGRLSSRELSSLADALNPSLGNAEVLTPFLEIAHERFPGEFWVHFRLAFHSQFTSGKFTKEQKKERSEATRRHLTAALAIRPKSAIARAALAMERLEVRKDDPEGLRMLHSAAEADPTSPWPHLFIGIHALERKDWPEAFRAMKASVRADPDVGFFMSSSMAIMLLSNASEEPKGPRRDEIIAFMNELIAAQPKHPGGYDLLAKLHSQMGDNRAALAMYLKANEFISPDYPGRFVIEASLKELEAKARWEEKLPAVVRGELKPANSEEVVELAGYCATFERRYALATKFAAEALKEDPLLNDLWPSVAQMAGWAVQAGSGSGVDAADHTDADRTEFRRLALEWLKKLTKRSTGTRFSGLYLSTIRDFAPVRDKEELAKLPEAERAEWERFWADNAPAVEIVGANSKSNPKPREPAPSPREKRP